MSNTTPIQLTDAPEISWNALLSRNAFVTLGGNRSLQITDPIPGKTYLLQVTQDSTGSRSLTLPSGSIVANNGYGAITLTSTPGAKDILEGYYDGTKFSWTIDKNFTSAAQQIFAYNFTTLTQDAPFIEMDGMGLVGYSTQLRMLGGWNGSESPDTFNTDWKSFDGISWTQNSDAPWERRHCFGNGVKDDKIWVWGGDFQTASYQKDVWTYDALNGWIEVTSDWGAVGDRIIFAHCIHKNYLYVLGGQNANFTSPTMNNTVYRSEDGVTWEHIGDLPTSYFATGVAWSKNDILYIAGGGRYLASGADNLNNKVYKSEDDGETWTEIATLATEMTGTYPTACVWDNKLWYLNGFRSDANQPGLYYSEDGITWLRFYTNPPARHASSMAVLNDKLYIVAGNSYNDAYSIEKLPIEISSTWKTWYDSLQDGKPSYDLTNSLNELVDGLTGDDQMNAIKILAIAGGMETEEQRLRPLTTTSSEDCVKISNVTIDSKGSISSTTGATNTKWNFIDNGDGATQNDCFIAGYGTANDVTSDTCDFGNFGSNNTEALVFSKGTDNTVYFSLNNTGQLTYNLGAGSSLGFRGVIRTNSSQITGWIDNTQSTGSKSSTTPEAKDFYISAFNYNGTVGSPNAARYQGCFVAGIGSLIDMQKLRDRLTTFFQQRGLA